MKELVFLLEEKSAQALLESLLPRLLNEQVTPRFIPFEGKQDLQKQLMRKVRGYVNPQARFIIIQDQDSFPDCRVLKGRLLDLCRESGRATECLVRIACKELETYYLADLLAVEQALGVTGLAAKQQSEKFRMPDRIGNPSKELKMLTRDRYEKVAGSRKLGRYLSIDNERSPSFRNLISGIRRMESELLSLPL
jgi:Domain of unknown function (DUF4276)